MSSANTTIAKHYNSTSYDFDGNIGHIINYDRTLTAAEVLQNYNAMKGRYE